MAATHYHLFCKRVRYWARRLGLSSWHIDTRKRSFPRDTETLAQVVIDSPQRYARVEWNSGFKPCADAGWDIEDTALHEVSHIFFAELIREVANSRSETDQRVTEVEHESINRLCAAFLHKGW